MSELERRYRRLLGLYPRDHREDNGEEMLGVLLESAGDRRKPGWRDSADLVRGAVQLHLRRVVAVDGGVDVREVFAVVALLGPIAMLAGATTALHELAWWVRAGALGQMPWTQQVPDAPVWGVWAVVAALSVCRLRRAAAVAAWVGAAGLVVLAFVGPVWWWGPRAGWVLTGVLTAVALTWAAGAERGREQVGTRAVLVLAVTVLATTSLGVLGFGDTVAEWLAPAVAVVGALAACGPRSRTGRRAALVLLLPVMTALLATALTGSIRIPTALEAVVFLALPVVVLLALGAMPRRIRL
ncbi:hypothetical protein [Actinokineospora pegani]|uniref:hypothetical protein n=1 Tax=Actinokineospora pegani TaxID=2654637 RepID=UPI0012EA95E6|nr:hypothetical protein [Actinokineospora pegani]